MTIVGELDRARRLAFADDEATARDLLLSLMPRIEAADSDELLMEVFAQLGEIYLARGANDGAAECIRRIEDCMGIYTRILAGDMPEAAALVTMPDAEIARMVDRYLARTQFLRVGLAAVRGDHDDARSALAMLVARKSKTPELADEHRYCVILATVACATALCDDDLHAQSVPLWEAAIELVEQLEGDTSESADRLRVTTGTQYGRFCVETGMLAAGEPWLRKAAARAQLRNWELSTARAKLERGAAAWVAGDHESTDQLITEAYAVIARYARAHEVSRCWLYLGLTRMAVGALEQADECWDHAERHWRELGKPLYIHRILLQRSWIAIFRGRFADAVELVAQAREWLDTAPGASWLQYARLDDHLGTIWRADALTDLGFDGAGDPDATIDEVQAAHVASLGITTAETGSPGYLRALAKLEQAAELKLPAALAVDSVRYTITDADARARWATCVSAPMLAGAFAVAWEWENTALISELIEYHSARGAFLSEAVPQTDDGWTFTATPQTPADDMAELAAIAAGPPARVRRSLTRLGALPPLQMDPAGAPILRHYRELAAHRYGRELTAHESPWATWP